MRNPFKKNTNTFITEKDIRKFSKTFKLIKGKYLDNLADQFGLQRIANKKFLFFTIKESDKKLRKRMKDAIRTRGKQ
jgi:hypothetical protein